VEWLVAQLAERGFRATVDDAGNAVGEIGDGAHHVVLLGHIDTVPGEIPVRIEGDELVGRGAVDAKGPLAAFVAAATRPPASRAFDRLDCRLEGIRAGNDDGMSERAELRIGYRLPPGIDPRELEREAEGLIRNGAGSAPDASAVAIETVGMEEPVRTARTSPLARAFARAIAEAGAQATFKEKSGTSDMNILAHAWGCPMVAYGPGDSRY